MSHSIRKPAVMGNRKLRAPKKVGLQLDTEEMWQRLSKAISQVQDHNISSLSYEEHYRYAYNMVLQSKGDMLYSGVRSKVSSHLLRMCVEKIVPAFPHGGSSVIPAGMLSDTFLHPTSSSAEKGKGKALESAGADVATSSGASAAATTFGGDMADMIAKTQAGERLLLAVRDTWDEHCACMSKLVELLRYVDREYVGREGVPTLWDLGLELFRDKVVLSKKYPIHKHLFSTILTQIQAERQGSTINRSVVKSNVIMLSSLTHAQARAVPSSANSPSSTSVAALLASTVYKVEFEPSFLKVTSAFYTAEASRLLDECDAATYLRRVEKRFVEEEDRIAVYLLNTTDTALRRLLERHLLEAHLGQILHMDASGLYIMLDEADLSSTSVSIRGAAQASNIAVAQANAATVNLSSRVGDLARMYRLFSRAEGGHDMLKKGLRSYIASRGKIINDGVLAPVSAAEEGGQDVPRAAASAPARKPATEAGVAPLVGAALRWVQEVLDFKEKFDRLLHVAYNDDQTYQIAMNEAFESFINTNTRAPEFISLFIDENLKKGLKGKSEEEVETVLSQSIVVFRFLHEKDVFETYYKGHLSKRLLQGRSLSDDAERNMLAKLKVEVGTSFVQKLTGMLNDMKTSEETMNAFARSMSTSERPLPFDLSVNVLTSQYWPLKAKTVPCKMPAIMLETRQRFEKFYENRHSGRILSWHADSGTADIRVAFRSRKHELNVSTYALVVLLLFENLGDEESLSYEDLLTSTDIKPVDLQRTLQALACAKYKILLKSPKGREVRPGDRFAFNNGFQAPLARIKIATIAARVENQAERKETTEKVAEERKNQVEACIVRVMKDRKSMSHNELINEVIRQLIKRFQPAPALVKKRIESLIDREYLERSEDANVYLYVA